MVAAAPLAIAAAGVSAVGQVMQGQAARAAGRAQQAYNESAAQSDLMAAAADAAKMRDQTTARVGAAVTQYAHSGVTMDGSPADIVDRLRAIGETDAANIERRGRMAADARRFQGAQAAAAGNNAFILSLFGAGGTMLGGYAGYRALSAGAAPVVDAVSSTAVPALPRGPHGFAIGPV